MLREDQDRLAELMLLTGDEETLSHADPEAMMPRDHALLKKLSERSMEHDLPAELAGVTGPRLAQLRGSMIHRYWHFMNPPTVPPALPVPRSIMDPGHWAWTSLLITEPPVRHGWRNRLILGELYGLSVQERIQVRDSLRYTVLRAGREEQAGPPEVGRFAHRVIRQLGEILARSGLVLRPRVYLTPNVGWPSLIACRFETEDLVSPEAARAALEERTEPLEWPGGVTPRVKLLAMLPSAIRAEAKAGMERIDRTDQMHRMARIAPNNPALPIVPIDEQRQTLRIYDESSFWIIASNRERLWSEARALLEADGVMDDHLTWPRRREVTAGDPINPAGENR